MCFGDHKSADRRWEAPIWDSIVTKCWKRESLDSCRSSQPIHLRCGHGERFFEIRIDSKAIGAFGLRLLSHDA